MVKILKIVVTIGVSIFIYSCSNYVPNRVKKNFTYCYNPKNFYNENYLRFNGYYILKHAPFEITNYDHKGNKIIHSVDSTFNSLIFFQDGVFVLSDTKLDRTLYEINYLNEVEQRKKPDFEQFYNWGYWGIYKITKDTIKLQYMSRQPFLNPYWTLIEVWYEVLDKGRLRVVYAKDYIHDNKNPYNENIIDFEFIETNIKLPSDTWLKQQKWFWCDENEWRKYMNSLKFRKKNVKGYSNLFQPFMGGL